MARFTLFFVALAGLTLCGPVFAKVVPVSPNTDHTSLTLSTDETKGFFVVPGKPLKFEVIGPGTLNLTIRLNQKGKQPTLNSLLEIKRGNKVVKKEDLKLTRSRVGAYKEDASLSPSLPKAVKIVVPDGRQTYTVTLKGGRGISATISFSYETEADQSLLAQTDLDVGLVPLVPPGGDVPPLEPVVPTTPPEDKGSKPETKPAAKPADTVATKPETKPATKPADTVATKPETKPATKPPEVVPPKPVDKKPEAVVVVAPPPPPPAKVEPVPPPPTTPPVEPPVIGGKVEKKRKLPVVSLGLKVGQITPFQYIGKTTVTGSLDVRYVLPVMEGRLTVGAEFGFYLYKLTVTNQAKTETMVFPISVQMFYRIPLKLFFEPFVGLGGDLFVVSDKSTPVGVGGDDKSGTSLAYGGHLAAGLESKLGPGYLMIEARAAMSWGDSAVWGNLHLANITTVLGYRFVF